jgi:hypothetical protein
MGFNVYMQGERGAVLPDLDNPSLHFTVFCIAGSWNKILSAFTEAIIVTVFLKKSVIGDLAYPMAVK